MVCILDKRDQMSGEKEPRKRDPGKRPRKEKRDLEKGHRKKTSKERPNVWGSFSLFTDFLQKDPENSWKLLIVAAPEQTREGGRYQCILELGADACCVCPPPSIFIAPSRKKEKSRESGCVR